MAFRFVQYGLNDLCILLGQRYGRAVVSASGDQVLQSQAVCIVAIVLVVLTKGLT